MLEWMGKKKVVNHHNDVPFHVLERNWRRVHLPGANIRISGCLTFSDIGTLLPLANR